MSDTLWQDIIFTILEMTKDNSVLRFDELFSQVESATLSRLNQLIESSAGSKPK